MGYSTYNIIVNNSVSNSRYGIALFNSDCNNIINNLVYTNQYGIYLWDECTGNYIIDNEIMYSSQYGVYLWNSGWNTFYHNDFIWNANHAYIMISDSLQWDDGYPSGGNYWSDYTGADEYNGINQDIPGSDGIGDSPYFIVDGNQDNYPQMQQIREVPTFNINLTMGWNLISIPLILFSNSVPDILASISGKWSVVKYYDTLDIADPWKSYRPGWTMIDMTEIDNNKGF